MILSPGWVLEWPWEFKKFQWHHLGQGQLNQDLRAGCVYVCELFSLGRAGSVSVLVSVSSSGGSNGWFSLRTTSCRMPTSWAFSVIFPQSILLQFAFLFIYLGCLCCSMQTPSCSMWDLVPWAGFEPGPPALGVQSLSHWTMAEDPVIDFLRQWFSKQGTLMSSSNAHSWPHPSSADSGPLWWRGGGGGSHTLQVTSVRWGLGTTHLRHLLSPLPARRKLPIFRFILVGFRYWSECPRNCAKHETKASLDVLHQDSGHSCSRSDSSLPLRLLPLPRTCVPPSLGTSPPLLPPALAFSAHHSSMDTAEVLLQRTRAISLPLAHSLYHAMPPE